MGADLGGFFEDIKARGFSPRGMIDVGANYGNWARMALSHFPGVPLIMIEPQQEMKTPLSQIAEQTGAIYIQAGSAWR